MGGSPRYFTALDWLDTDILYTYHRFFRKNVIEPNRKDPNTWFFHLRIPGLVEETGAENNNTGMGNVTVAGIAESNCTFTWEGVGGRGAPTWVTKTFHRTSAGHRETKNAMMWKLYYVDVLESLAGIRIDLMVIGDIVAAGSHNPQSEIYQGFCGHLRSILHD
ncbi:hypothetical protein N7G274_010713 [Stereocaulon virgatum]|uniref:Uncharacterized protein n=1 Tax=Stereocaulon virgatum TaxID=373712 RepID=A0ABR3ZUZ1_9LECA